MVECVSTINQSEFLKSDEVENKDDLEIQVKFLKRINQLIDNGVFSLPKKI